MEEDFYLKISQAIKEDYDKISKDLEPPLPTTNVAKSEKELSWIEKDVTVGEILIKYLNEQPANNPLQEVSYKLLRDLLMKGFEEGLKLNK